MTEAAVAAAVEAATAVVSVVLSITEVIGMPVESFCLRTSASILLERYSLRSPYALSINFVAAGVREAIQAFRAFFAASFCASAVNFPACFDASTYV